MPIYNLGTAHGNIAIDTSGLRSAEQSFRQTGFALAGIGTALVGGVAVVIKTAADFEAQMSAVSAISGETGANMDLLRQKALDLGKEGPFGPQAISEAFVELIKAGLTTKEILDGVAEATINLASSGDLSLERSGEILANTLRTFQLSADQAGHVADVLQGAANASTIDVEDMAFSLKYAGSVASAVGISLEDTAGALVELGNAGIKGSTGGTTLRRILLQLNPASKAASKELKSLGIITEDGSNQFFTAEGKAKSLGEVFDILKVATAGMSDEQKIASLNTIFGARAVAGALILLRDGSQGLADAQDQINRTTAESVATEKLDNLEGSLKKLKATIQAVMIEAGTPFQSVLKGIVDILRKAIEFFGSIPQPIQTAILVVIAFVGILALLSGGFLLIISPILQMIRLFGELPVAVSAVRGAISGLTGVVQAFTASLLTNPIFLIIAAIVALVAGLVLLYFHWKPFHDFVDGLWQDIQGIWDDVLGFFQDLPAKLGTAYDAVKDVLGNTFGWIRDNWKSILEFFASPIVFALDNIDFDTFKDKLTNVTSGIGDLIQGDLKGAGEQVSKFFNQTDDAKFGKDVTRSLQGVEEAAKDLVHGDLGQVGKDIEQILNVPGDSNFADTMNTGIDAVLGKLDPFGQKILDIKDSIKGLFTNDKATIGTGITNPDTELGDSRGKLEKTWDILVDIGKTKSQELLDKVDTTISAMPGAIGYYIGLVIGTTARQLRDWASTAISNAQLMVQGIIAWVQGLPATIGNFILQVIFTTAAHWQEWVSGAVFAGARFVEGVISFISTLPGRISGWMSQAVNTIVGFVGTLISKGWEMGSGFVKGFFDGLGNIISRISDIFNGVVDTVRGFISRVGNAAKDFGSGVWNGIKDGLDIHSPSNVERAFFAMRDNVGDSLDTMFNDIGGLSNIRQLRSELNFSIPNTIAPSAIIPTTAVDATNGQQGFIVQGPLVNIENASVRNDEDITRISRGLNDKITDEQAALGRKVLP